MNIENLTSEEVLQLQSLLSKLNSTKQVKVDLLTEMVDDILEHFNFEKVQKTMQTLNWKWIDTMAIPDVRELKETAKYLLTRIYNLKLNEFKDISHEIPISTSTGGFTATVYSDEENKINLLKLEFIVESCESSF